MTGRSSIPKTVRAHTRRHGVLDAPLEAGHDNRGTHLLLLATQIAPELCLESVPQNKRAQGMPGARCTRGLVCKMHKGKHTRAFRFSGGNPAFPAQWFYGLFRALLGDRAFLPPSPAKTCFRRLDASVGASGPHDFAVRASAARLASPKRPPHPAPTFVTTRTSLLSGRDAPDSAADLGEGSTASGCGRLARRANDGPSFTSAFQR